MFKKKVDFKEFLPNSVANNAKKRMHSNTYLTQRLNLYDVRGGFGSHSEVFERQRHSEMITRGAAIPIERGEDGEIKVSEKKEGFGLQCHGPRGTMKTPKSALAENERPEREVALKPFNSLLGRSSMRGSEANAWLTTREAEDTQAGSTGNRAKALEFDTMSAMIDLNPEANAKKINGRVEAKLLQEKILLRKARLGLAPDEDLVSYNSAYTSGFNKLVPEHIAV